MSDYITKPLNKAELLKMVAKWLAAGDPVEQAEPESLNDSAEELSDEHLPIDFEKAVAEFDGMRELVSSLLEEFLELAAGQVQTMTAALGQQDYEVLAAEAHTIKGGAGNVHAVPVSEAAKQIEVFAAARDDAGLRQGVAALDTELRRLKDYLRQLAA